MEWLSNSLAQDHIVLFSSIGIVVTIFILAARKAHLNYVAKMKKINEAFNPKKG